MSITVRGSELAELPKDLYIPPNALRILLDIFEGPLDLLRYLVQKHNLDILQIDVAQIADQYVAYINMIKKMDFTLAADYLSISAWLIELKSRYLLPRLPEADDEEKDPRAELIERVLAYEQIRIGAERIDELPRINRDHFASNVHPFVLDTSPPLPEVSLRELIGAMLQVVHREQLTSNHLIGVEQFSIEDRMGQIRIKLQSLDENSVLRLSDIFRHAEGIAGLVVAFLALLELVAIQEIGLVQHSAFGEIYVVAT